MQEHANVVYIVFERTGLGILNLFFPKFEL